MKLDSELQTNIAVHGSGPLVPSLINR